MNFLKVAFLVAAITTSSIVALENNPSSTNKTEATNSELNKTEKLAETKAKQNVSHFVPSALTTTEKLEERINDLKGPQPTPNKRSVANYGYNTYDSLNRYNTDQSNVYEANRYHPNSYQTTRYKPKSRKSKSRNRKSRQKNKKSDRFNRVGRDRRVFGKENRIPHLEIKNTRPLINISNDLIYKNLQNMDQNIKHEKKTPQNPDPYYLQSQYESRKSRSEPKDSELDQIGNKIETFNTEKQDINPGPKKLESESISFLSKPDKAEQKSTNKPQLKDTNTLISNQTTTSFSNASETLPNIKIKIQEPNVFERMTPDIKQDKTEYKDDIFIAKNTSFISIPLSTSTPVPNTPEHISKKTETKYKNAGSNENIRENRAFQSMSVEIVPKLEENKNHENNKLEDQNKHIPILTKFLRSLPDIKKPESGSPIYVNTPLNQSFAEEHKTSHKNIKPGTETKLVENNSDLNNSRPKNEIKQLIANNPEFKNAAEPETKKSDTENKSHDVRELTNSDLESILSDFGIEDSEPKQEAINLKITPNMEERKPISAEHKKYTRDSKNSTASERNISSQDIFKNEEIEPKSISNISNPKNKQPKSDFKNTNIQLSQLSKNPGLGYSVVKPALAIVEKEQVNPEYTSAKSKYAKEISKTNPKPMSQQVPPEQIVQNNKMLEPTLGQSDFKYRSVDEGTNRYKFADKPTTNEFKNPKPEIKQYKTKRFLPISKNGKPENKKPQSGFLNPSSIPVLDHRKPQLGSINIEPIHEHRQSKTKYREITISADDPKYKKSEEDNRKELKPEIKTSAPSYKSIGTKLRKVTAHKTDDSKYEKSKTDYHQLVLKYETPVSKNRKAIPKNSDSNSRKFEQQNQRSDSRDREPQVGSEPQVEFNQPKRDNISSSNSRKFRTDEYQESKIRIKGDVLKTKNVISEHGKIDPKYRLSEPESGTRVTKYKELKPEYREVRKYKKSKPDYKQSGVNYIQATNHQRQESRKPRFEKYRPDMRKFDEDVNTARPEYKFQSRKQTEGLNGYISTEEQNTTFNRKYRNDKNSYDPKYNQSKIEYNVFESQNKRHQIKYKEPRAKSSDIRQKNSDSENRKTTTMEKVELESKMLVTEHSNTRAGEKDDNTTQKGNFFYKAIKDWW